MSDFKEALAAIRRGMEAVGATSVDAYEDTGLVVENKAMGSVDPMEPPFFPNEEEEDSIDDCGTSFELSETSVVPAPLDNRYAYAGETENMGELGRIYQAVVNTAKSFKEGVVKPGCPVTLDNGEVLHTYVYSNSKLSYLRTRNILYVEQNENKASKYAELHRSGSFVMWCIDHRTDTYLGYILNGHVYTTQQ